MTDEFDSNTNDKFVDIHGREIPTITAGKNSEVVFALADLRQTGVGIYQRSQYAKLSRVDTRDFDTDFVDHMLESAKSYMLNNRISFSQEQIMSSIENCKTVLTGTKKPTPQLNFLKNRSVATTSDDDILIQVTTAPVKTSPIVNKQKSPIPRKSLSRSQSQSENQNFAPNVQPKNIRHDTEKHKPKDNPPLEEICANGERQNQNFKRPEKVNQKDKRYSVGKEHDVVVTRIDKRNCVWVRDVANNELFDTIQEKVNEEADFQRPALKPWKMDTVYMALEDGCWFRCKIVKYSPLTVFFLDYGNVSEVEEIRDVSEELAKIPCMAVRITFKESEYDPRFEDKIRIKRFLQNDDGTLFVNVLKILPQEPVPSTKRAQTPLEASGYSQTFTKKNPSRTPEDPSFFKKPLIPEYPSFFKKPLFFCHPENDQRVVIAHLEDGMFYLRTRECFEKLREVEQDIEEQFKTARNVHNVKVNQLVLYKNNGKFYRGQVSKVNKKNVRVECLDYVESATVDLTMLKTISEPLSKVPMTCFPGGKLAGFEDTELDENCKRFVEQEIRSRKKYRVVLGFDDELDLFDGTQLLSEQLQKLPKRPAGVFLKDIKTFKPEFGITSYLCGCYKSSSDFALVPSDKLQDHIDYVLRSEIDDVTPYTPQANEVCLCYFVDQWYRCVVTRIFDKECEVLLLDFGNVELIKKDQLRKPDDAITEIPALALPCKLVGLPHRQNVEDLLKSMIFDGEIYNVNVKSINEGKYHVEIPSVYQKILEQ